MQLNIPVCMNNLALALLFSAVSQGKQFESGEMVRRLPLTDDIKYLQKDRMLSHTQKLILNYANSYFPKNISNIGVYRGLRSAESNHKRRRTNPYHRRPQRKTTKLRHDRKTRKLFYVDGRSSTTNYPGHHRRRHVLRRYPIAHRRRMFSFETERGYNERRHRHKPMYRGFKRHRIRIISERRTDKRKHTSQQRLFSRRAHLLKIPEQRRKKYVLYKYRHSHVPHKRKIPRRGGIQVLSRKMSHKENDVKKKYWQRSWRPRHFGKRRRIHFLRRGRAHGIGRRIEYLPRFKAARQHRHKRRFLPNEKQKKILREVRAKILHKRRKEMIHIHHGKTNQVKKITVNDLKKVKVPTSGHKRRKAESSGKSRKFSNVGQLLQSPCKEYQKKLEKMAKKIDRSLHKVSILAKIIGKKFGISEGTIDKILKKEEGKISDRFLAMLFE